ncbi:MAG: GPGG-motif small membrane protein, partial [Brevibacterium linens]
MVRTPFHRIRLPGVSFPVPPAEAPSPPCQVSEAVLDWRFEGEPVAGKQTSQSTNEGVLMAVILWILAAILVISGIFAIFRKQILWG